MQGNLHCSILWPTPERIKSVCLRKAFRNLPIAPDSTTVQPGSNLGKAMIDNMDSQANLKQISPLNNTIRSDS
jgi:hypothetical protein